MRLKNNQLLKKIMKSSMIKKIPDFIKPILSLLYNKYGYALPNRLKGLITPRKSRNELYQYWRKPNDGANQSADFIVRMEQSKFLFKFIKEYVDSQAKILEIGCNVGRNLNYLFNAGYKNLEGVEISEEAIDLMKRTYPETAKSIEIYNNPIEEVIKNFGDGAFDLIFTVAVLEHIHSDSEFIFPEMVRITKKHLITIEDERGITWRHFPRNYKKVFESLGMKQIQQVHCQDGDGRDFTSNFRARVFMKL